MVRARGIFGVRDAVVVTQGFHMPRALYLADAAGIEATGLTADLHQWGYQGRKSEVREVLSRVKAIADVTLDTPAMAGPQDPDRDRRRPRKLGPGAAARHAPRRLARPLSRAARSLQSVGGGGGQASTGGQLDVDSRPRRSEADPRRFERLGSATGSDPVGVLG